MRRGTTPTFTFTLPFDAELVKKAKVTIVQDAEKFVSISVYPDQFEGNEIKVTLSQEQTLQLSNKFPASVQLRVILERGEALASNIYRVFVEECLDDEVLQ